MNFFAKGEKKINFLDVLSTAALTAASIREQAFGGTLFLFTNRFGGIWANLKYLLRASIPGINCDLAHSIP